ncbi:MAG: hypothetical protein QM564_10830 [Bergeyella sp.]
MKKGILFIGVFLAQFAFGQVSLEKNKLVKDGQTYKMSQYADVFQNQEALSLVKKYRTNNTVANVFAVTGGFGLGYGLTTLISGKKNTISANGTTYTKEAKKGGWAFLAAGVGLVGIGIPFAIASKKNMDKAIQIENGEATAFQPYFQLEPTGNGLALSYNF